MRKIPYLLSLCLLAGLGSMAQNRFDTTVLAYARNSLPAHGVKILTNLPFSNSSQMPTIILEGYCFGIGTEGTYAPVGIILNYYILNNGFMNYRASSFGAYTPVIKLANENNKVVIFIDSKDYFLRFSVRAYSAGLSADIPEHYRGWTVADAAVTGTPVVTVPYRNAFGGQVTVSAPSATLSVPQAQAALHVTTAVPSGGDGIAAILGSHFRHFTHFGGLGGGRIRGASEGYLVVESNPDGVNKNLYLNNESSGNILMARGGGNVAIGRDEANAAVNPLYKLQVLGTIGARKVKVTQETWADDALRPGYHMPSLPELAAFIRQYGHLPGIPSEKEVKSEGIDVGDMDSRLLRKIEELTLYIIRQDEENAAMRKSLQQMEEKLDKLEKKAVR